MALGSKKAETRQKMEDNKMDRLDMDNYKFALHSWIYRYSFRYLTKYISVADDFGDLGVGKK